MVKFDLQASTLHFPPGILHVSMSFLVDNELFLGLNLGLENKNICFSRPLQMKGTLGYILIYCNYLVILGFLSSWILGIFSFSLKLISSYWIFIGEHIEFPNLIIRLGSKKTRDLFRTQTLYRVCRFSSFYTHMFTRGWGISFYRFMFRHSGRFTVLYICDRLCNALSILFFTS